MAVVGGKVLVVLSICILASDALFFHISETETKCFIEEVPDETLIVGGCSDSGAFALHVCFQGIATTLSTNAHALVSRSLSVCVCILTHF